METMKRSSWELGRGESAVAFNHVLRGNDDKGPGQRPHRAVGAHLPLRHCFQKGRLGAGAGPVQFVGHYYVSKNRARDKFKGLVAHVKDRRARNIAGQQVWSELDAGKLPVNRGGDSLGQQGLADAGQALQQDMALGKQPQQGQPDVVGRSDYYTGNVVYQLLKSVLEIFQGQGFTLCNPAVRPVGKGRLEGILLGQFQSLFPLYLSLFSPRGEGPGMRATDTS
jgi:hypothetical protein